MLTDTVGRKNAVARASGHIRPHFGVTEEANHGDVTPSKENDTNTLRILSSLSTGSSERQDDFVFNRAH